MYLSTFQIEDCKFEHQKDGKQKVKTFSSFSRQPMSLKMSPRKVLHLHPGGEVAVQGTATYYTVFHPLALEN